MWILRNLTEDHGGREEGKNGYTEGGRETIRDLKSENKLRVDGRWEGGKSG